MEWAQNKIKEGKIEKYEALTWFKLQALQQSHFFLEKMRVIVSDYRLGSTLDCTVLLLIIYLRIIVSFIDAGSMFWDVSVAEIEHLQPDQT